MYTTRYSSQLRRSPGLLSKCPEGLNSGYLVIQDEEPEITYEGFLKSKVTHRKLPFPQNKELVVEPSEADDASYFPVYFIPVLDQPLSSNLYYAIDPHNKHIGKAFTCSREKKKVKSCFSYYDVIIDDMARPLDPRNIYQQFEIVTKGRYNGSYYSANSIASDGFPPWFLREGVWKIFFRPPEGQFKLDEALGLNSKLRANPPEINSAPNIVGKWYCPFMFVKDGTLRDQVKRAMYYEMTLEQRWEHIFSCPKKVSDLQWNFFIHHGNSVTVNALVQAEEVFIGGKKAVWSKEKEVIWFMGKEGEGGKVGLREEVVSRMKWEQEKGGWVSGDDKKQVRINQIVRKETRGEWKEMKCYILVERFNLKRMDGSLVMSYDFKHSRQLRSVWE